MEENFHNFDELIDNILRGGEIEFTYNKKKYTVYPWSENERNMVTMMEEYNYDSAMTVDLEEVKKIGEYALSGKRFMDVIQHCEITFRCF